MRNRAHLRTETFSSEHSLSWLAVPPPPHDPFTIAAIVAVGALILLLIASLSANEDPCGIPLPSWGDTPANQQQPENALFPKS